MINFKKAYNLITACLLIMALVCPSLAYSSENACLRVPVQIDSVRLNEAIEKLSDQGKNDKVVKSIQKLQSQGLVFDTINRRIKQEFDEATYHLQEWVRRSDKDSFYVTLNGKYFEIIDSRIKSIDKATFEQGRRILVKVVRGAYTKEELISEVKKVVAKLGKKLKRPPNIREIAETMPSLQTSRNPAALLYKHFQEHKLNPYDYGIGRYSGKANLVFSKRFLFAGVRVYTPAQLDGKISISADKTPISNETRIDIVDIKNPENRLTVEHVRDQDLLRLTYTQQHSGRKITEDIPGIKGKTGVTLTGGAVFSDFYDTVFSIPLQPGRDRLKAVAEHLIDKRFGVNYEQSNRTIDFHGKLVLPSWYETHPGRIKVYRDRENDARFLLLEDIANPDNVVGYEWRENKIVPFENGSELEMDSVVKDAPFYYLHRSDVFRAGFDRVLNKSVEVITATPGDTRQSDISMGTCRFLFRVKKDVSVVAFEGFRSSKNITRDDRENYPIKIYSGEDKEIVIKYRNPDVQGEFVIEGLNWEDGSSVVLKGPSGYETRRGYFNISTIVEMLRQGLLPGIKASDLLFETFDFTVGIKDVHLTRPVRSYKIETLESGEKVLVMDVLVDPETFKPWQGVLTAENSEKSFLERYPIVPVLRRMRHGGSVYDIAAHSNVIEFLDMIAEKCPAELREEIAGVYELSTSGFANLRVLVNEPSQKIETDTISDEILEDWEDRLMGNLVVFIEAQKRFAGLKERVLDESSDKTSVRLWSLMLDEELARCVAILEDGVNLTQGVVLEKETDVNETIKEVIKPYNMVEFKKGAIPKIYADPMMIGQIVKNIVVNADNMKRKIGITKIIINTELSEDEKEIVVTITNDGAGFDNNMLSARQEPDGSYEVLFGYGTTYREGGSGFGLAENELYAKLHNGSLRIFSRPSGENMGSTFILRVPVSTRQATEKLLIQRQSRTAI